MVEGTKGIRLMQNIRVGHPDRMDISGIRQAIRSDPTAFMHRYQDLVEKGQVTLRQIKDLRALYQATADLQVPVVVEDMGVQRAITTAAFPVLTGTTVVKAIQDAYDAAPTIGENLVTELDDPKAVTVIARLAALDNINPQQVDEGQDFPEIGVSEETVEILGHRNGRMLRITKEAIEQNDIANIVQRVDALGALASKYIEKLTLYRVMDVYGSAASAVAPYVYRPNGTNTALFSATANTPGTRAPSGTRYETNVLTDESDIENLRARMATHKDDNGDPIIVPITECVLLVPDALRFTAAQIKGSEYEPSTGGSLTLNPYGPRGDWSGWSILSSPYLDNLTTAGTTTYYWGAPKRQFVRKWGLRLEYVTMGESTEAFLRSRIAFQARVAWNCNVGALDYVYWLQSLSATTAPAV